MGRICRAACAAAFTLGAAGTMAPALGADTAGAEASSPVTFETPIGPVSCAVDPANPPGPEDITTVPFPRGENITILSIGRILCQTSTLGEVAITGAELPWHLRINAARNRARLHGSRQLALSVKPVSLPSLQCLYQSGAAVGTLGAEGPASVTLTTKRVKLNRAMSNPLCPALGPLSLSVTIP